MKCPNCNSDLVVKELKGKKYLVCGGCKKVFDPIDLLNSTDTGSTGSNQDAESPKLGLSICSMVLGIVGLLLSCLGIGFFPAVIGFVIAIIALATHRHKGMAIAGLVTSLIGIIIAAAILITGTAVNSVLEERGLISEKQGKKEPAKKDKKSSKKSSKSKEESASSEPEQPADDNMIDFNTGDYAVKYTGHAVGSDYEGNPCLIVYYDFTNNSSENASSAVSVHMKAFQNGVQCETAIFMEENEAMNNYMKDVQPGTTLNIGQCYSLSDMSPVTLEASELITLDDLKDTMTIQLQ